MNIIKKLGLATYLLPLLLLTHLNSAFATTSYVVDNKNSVVNFSVTKKQYIIEPAVFKDVEGTIDNKGNIKISIDINSVDSSNPIRDNRLVEMFFQADFFPHAIVTAKIDEKVLNSKKTFQQIELPATLEFFDLKKEIKLSVMVAKIGNNILVTSLKPTIINAKTFDVPSHNLAALSKVCGGINISDIVPVNFVLTFNKK
jgi:polyisoprenoid-binding protein YceI